ncbi:hypothetical protein Tco_0433893, partial [Tanacetum coccineum]
SVDEESATGFEKDDFRSSSFLGESYSSGHAWLEVIDTKEWER